MLTSRRIPCAGRHASGQYWDRRLSPDLGGLANMRRLLYFVVTAGLVAATAVALASASRTAPRSASATGESANAYLPKGTKPLMNDWNLPGGDQASTLYSQLKEINSNNVGGL